MDRQRLSHEPPRYAPRYTSFVAGTVSDRDGFSGLPAAAATTAGAATDTTSAAAAATVAVPRVGSGYYGHSYGPSDSHVRGNSYSCSQTHTHSHSRNHSRSRGLEQEGNGESPYWSGHSQRPTVQNLVLSTSPSSSENISSQDLTKTGYSLLFSSDASARPLSRNDTARTTNGGGCRGKWSNNGGPSRLDEARSPYSRNNIKLPSIGSAAFYDRDRHYPQAHSFSTPSKRAIGSSSLPPPADAIVQKGDGFEDYSNRLCHFVSDIGNHQHDIDPEMLPPSVVLPLESPRVVKQDLPFWRPPRVLQRDPHYNSAVSSLPPARLPSLSEKGTMCQDPAPSYSSRPAAAGPAYAGYAGYADYADYAGYSSFASNASPKRSPASPPSSAQHSSSDTAHSSLSSALLAISNSHYQQQIGSAAKTTLPSIHSLASHCNSEDEDRVTDSTGRSAATSTNASPMAPSRSPASQSHRGLRLAPIGGGTASETTNASAADSRSSAARESMSIACLVDSPDSAMSPIMSGTTASMSRKRSYGAAEAAHSLHKLARIDSSADVSRPCLEKTRYSPSANTVITYSSTREEPGLCPGNQVVITCYHAAVAQKSYGGEKRFLCPPPAVLMCGEGSSAKVAHGSAMVLSVVKEAGESPIVRCGEARPSSSAHAPLECQTSFNERNVALFKSLHVTGMQKAKSFRLRLDLLGGTTAAAAVAGAAASSAAAVAAAATNSGSTSTPYASLESGAVAIISKPSKKTAKARNQSTCIRGGALVSLFNRINSQTFRTKYLNVDHHTNRWVAQSHNWSPFSVEIVGGAPGSALYYGSEIVLIESHRNFRSPPMIICKVERGRLVAGASSPVSQMQKVALQLKQDDMSGPPRFLMADAGHYTPAAASAAASDSAARFEDSDSSPELTFEPAETSRLGRSRSRDSASEPTGQALDDAFCWTIVGISAFTCSYSVQRDQAVGSVPRITGMSLGSDGKLSIVTPKVDLCTETLLVDNRPLYVEKAHVNDTFSASLPLDIGPGSLVIRRSDGALFHTGWALRQGTSGHGHALELVECNLHI